MDAKKDNKKGTYRGKRKVKAKTEENLLFQAKKTISRVVKIVRVYLIRKNLRLEEGKRKLSTDDLKALSCDAAVEEAMPLLKGSIPISSMTFSNPCVEAVLKHSKTREITAIWAEKIADALKAEEEKKLKRIQRQSASSKGNSVLGKRETRQHSAHEGKKKAIFVESLAEEDSASKDKTKENKAWENKKRKLLRAQRREQVDLNIYMPLSERSESANRRFSGSHLMELRGLDAQDRRKDKTGQAKESEETLHPSWAAKKLAKEKSSYTLSIPEGKKIIFSDD